MKFSEVRESIINVVLAGHVPFVRGLHGIGKSEMMSSIAEAISEIKKKDVVFHEVDTAHIKEGELTGMPVTIKDPETGNMINTYTVYSLFNEVIKEDAQGLIPVIFFDEINRADRVVFNELMPIILARRVQELKLPDSVVILAAGNPEDITKYKGANDDYSVLPMDPALKDRYFIFELDVDPIEWLTWANKSDENNEKHVDEDIISYITEYPNMLHFLSNNEINPTPRGWTMFSNVYKILKKNSKDFSEIENSVIAIGGGKIGRDTAINFVRFMKDNKNPLIKPSDFFDEKITEEIFNINLQKLANDTPTRQYISMANITEYYIKKLESLKNKKKEKTEFVKKYNQILFKMPNDILIGSLKEMRDTNKKALAEIVQADPKAIIHVQKYLN